MDFLLDQHPSNRGELISLSLRVASSNLVGFSHPIYQEPVPHNQIPNPTTDAYEPQSPNRRIGLLHSEPRSQTTEWKDPRSRSH
jgi:hypothetical protein